MCGIVGSVWTTADSAISPLTLQRMMSRLTHRGPDDSGTFHSEESRDPSGTSASFPKAALGHRRLSIIDVEGGRQPISNETGDIHVVLNGEIYNFVELRDELSGKGHRFATQTDTEVIVHAYEEWGNDCVTRLRGMFAFAIWDERQRVLFLARDRLGQKPLVFREEVGRILFASELKALLAVEGMPGALNLGAVDLFLTYQYVPDTTCILEGFRKLPPGHYAIFKRGQLDVQSYWTPPFNTPAERSPGEWQSLLRERLTEAVQLRMRSDVPLGAFLSGGIDSTIIVGLMRSLSPKPIETFSIGFSVAAFDETAYAREAAEKFGTRHREHIVDPSAIEVLPQIIWHFDEPFADSSAIPTFWLSRWTRQHVTVALTGDGGDELFAGYDRYRAVRLASQFDRIPLLRHFAALRLWQSLPFSVKPKSRLRRLRRFAAELSETPVRRYLNWISYFNAVQRSELYTDTMQAALAEQNADDYITWAYEQCKHRDFVTRTTAADVHSYLPCDILRKVDIASMAHGLECRSPFLDHPVAELAAEMPIEMKLNRKGGKRALIETFSDLLPASIQRRRKMGFGVPLDSWFRDELKPLLESTLLGSTCLDRGYFRENVLRRMLNEHATRQADHSSRLWALLILELWCQMYVDSPTPPQSCPTSFADMITMR